MSMLFGNLPTEYEKPVDKEAVSHFLSLPLAGNSKKILWLKYR